MVVYLVTKVVVLVILVKLVILVTGGDDALAQ